MALVALQYFQNTSMTSVVDGALRQQTLGGVGKLLQDIACAFDAFGCILWEASPFSNMESGKPNGYLFVLAQWFSDEQLSVIHDLPFSSPTGNAVLTNRPENILDVESDARSYSDFIKRNQIQSFCTIPVTFLDGKRGALNLYRKGVDPFTPIEFAKIQEAALLVPSIYQAILNCVSLDLLVKVSDEMRSAQIEAQEEGEDLSIEHAREKIYRVCICIANAFQCLEATVLLEDKFSTPGAFRVVASTWPGKLKKTSYRASPAHGLTGWALANGQPLRIFDLARFDTDLAAIRQQYPGVRWKDQDHVQEKARDYLPKGTQRLPALSFVVIPILSGKRVIGALRCSIPLKGLSGPFYFADREVKLLHLVANQIGQFWSDLHTRRRIRQENKSWKSLVESVGKLNNFVYGELNKEIPEERRIFAEALRITRSAIDGVDIMDIRLLDEEKKFLYFFETAGEAWNRGAPEEILRRRSKKFPVGVGRIDSAGAYVFQRRKVHVIEDTKRDPYYSETFPETRRMIVAPILFEGSIFGVLDIRGTGEGSFPKHANIMAELLGNQLGLYHYLATTIGKLKSAEIALKAKVEELSKTQRQEKQTFEDLTHQLKSPIFLAHARSQELLQSDSGSFQRSTLQAIRGLCGKAKRATLSVGLFADLARDRPLRLKVSQLYYSELLKLLSEAAADHEFLVDSDRRIRFQVDRESFAVLRNARVYVDHDLLEQAISNLLDNAGKYSYPNTIVRIHGGTTGKGRFHISVSSVGLPIRATEISDCIKRGWRSEKAQLSTGEGSGIGLWIVHNIMQAHNGVLVVAPTDSKSQNEVKLVFPANQEPILEYITR